MKKLLMLAVLLLGVATMAQAQERVLKILELKNGTEVTGYVMVQPDGSYLLETESGESVFYSANEVLGVRKVGEKKKKPKQKFVDKSANSFGSIWLTYSPITYTASGNGSSASSPLHGFSADYTHANKLMSIPLYIEFGLGLQYAFSKANNSTRTLVGISDNSLLSFRVPVRVIYRFDIPGSSISIIPYTGLNFIVHAMWRMKFQEDIQLNEEEVRAGRNEDVFTLFKRQGVDYNRFNMDWHFGARVMFNKFFLAASYEIPLIGLYNKNSFKEHFSQANISLGFSF